MKIIEPVMFMEDTTPSKMADQIEDFIGVLSRKKAVNLSPFSKSFK